MTTRPAPEPACFHSPMADFFTAEPDEDRGVTAADIAAQREAAAHLCLTRCPLLHRCGANAEAARLSPTETVKPFGVLGGLFYSGTGRPPRVVLPPPRTPAKPRPLRPIKHGTAGGEAAHRRRGETPCEPCADARSEYDAERKRQQRARKAAAA